MNSRHIFKSYQVLKSNQNNLGEEKKPLILSQVIKTKLLDIPLKTIAISFGAIFASNKQVYADNSGNDLELITNKGNLITIVIKIILKLFV